MPFKRPCERCGKKFQPVTRFNKVCNECRIKVMTNVNNNKKNDNNPSKQKEGKDLPHLSS